MKYIFEHAQDRAELERLQLLERLHDPRTRRLIGELAIPSAGHCLEIGPGAGSVMRWLASEVVADGRVTAIDLNSAFCAPDAPANATLRQADLRETTLEPESFDLIHGRFVVVFMPDYRTTVAKLVSALRPGGWLLLEEVDFASARPTSGDDASQAALGAVNDAILRMFRSGGLDPAFGTQLASLFEQAGLTEVQTHCEDTAGAGGSLAAQVMKRSTHKLRDAYLDTGAATAAQIDAYLEHCDDPAVSALHHRTICAWGRRARVSGD